ncbi:PAS-domain containing protein [Bradyrhizobium sp. CCBAU 051011]|nr:PAS-domain containing protein [Bradyrhizobium sp. CCBAU 051011]
MEKLDAALNNMSHGLCMLGPDNRLLLWNDRYVKMYKAGARPPARRMHAR